jgi:nucleolar protein 12
LTVERLTITSQDRECVDEILAMPSEKLKFAKRSLRVQPCKSLPPSLGGAATSLPKPKPVELKKSDGKRTGKPAYKPTPVAIKIPKGDPKLGEKLASLSKDERKVAKSSDADRLARRLAKKQSLKAKSALADKNSRVKLDVRSNRKDGMKKIKAKKSRVRSENAAKNVKGKRD